MKYEVNKKEFDSIIDARAYAVSVMDPQTHIVVVKLCWMELRVGTRKGHKVLKEKKMEADYGKVIQTRDGFFWLDLDGEIRVLRPLNKDGRLGKLVKR